MSYLLTTLMVWADLAGMFTAIVLDKKLTTTNQWLLVILFGGCCYMAQISSARPAPLLLPVRFAPSGKDLGSAIAAMVSLAFALLGIDHLHDQLMRFIRAAVADMLPAYGGTWTVASITGTLVGLCVALLLLAWFCEGVIVAANITGLVLLFSGDIAGKGAELGPFTGGLATYLIGTAVMFGLIVLVQNMTGLHNHKDVFVRLCFQFCMAILSIFGVLASFIIAANKYGDRGLRAITLGLAAVAFMTFLTNYWPVINRLLGTGIRNLKRRRVWATLVVLMLVGSSLIGIPPKTPSNAPSNQSSPAAPDLSSPSTGLPFPTSTWPSFTNPLLQKCQTWNLRGCLLNDPSDPGTEQGAKEDS